MDDILSWRADALALHEVGMDEQRILGLTKVAQACGGSPQANHSRKS